MSLMHPIFSVLLKRPELVMDHVAGYATLAREEAATAAGEVARRAVAWAVAVLGFIMFMVLAGAAAMLGLLQGQFHWVLLAVPGIALAIAVAGALMGMRKLAHAPFNELRSQLDADAQALRTLGTS